MRPTFSSLLPEIALKDPRVLLLTGDHGYALFDPFRKQCPSQYLNCGVAEQNMVGVAAGLAKGGFRPIVYGLSAFVPIRVLEQIKIDVCYERLPVLFVGDGAGVVYSYLGVSHQSTEDISALRAIPNIEVHSPADRFELAYCMNRWVSGGAPTYLRFGKADCGDVHAGAVDAPFGAPIQVRKGRARHAFIATGSMVSRAIRLADEIGDTSVWSVPAITPFDPVKLLEACAPHEHVFTFEEHSINGGLGSLIAEQLGESGSRTKLTRLGIKGRFSQLCGSYDFLMNYHGLAIESLKEVVLARLGEASACGTSV